jgi:hypothetical protein
VLNGVTASSLSTTSGINFIPDPPAQAHASALFTQAMAAGLGSVAPTSAATTPALSTGAVDQALLTLPHQV